MTEQQKTELLNALVTFCCEDANFLENRLSELVELKGEGLDLDALISSSQEDTSFLENRLMELIDIKGEQLQKDYLTAV